jgi:hypothetical protein
LFKVTVKNLENNQIQSEDFEVLWAYGFDIQHYIGGIKTSCTPIKCIGSGCTSMEFSSIQVTILQTLINDIWESGISEEMKKLMEPLRTKLNSNIPVIQENKYGKN